MTGQVRQLDLFKSKRQRGVKLRGGPTEFEIHCMVADTLRASIRPGWDFWHTPNGGERPHFRKKNGKVISFEGGKLKRLGTKPGVSDLIVVGPDRFVGVLELKREGEEPSDEQVAFMAFMTMCGFEAAWADNVDDAIAVLKKWGAVRVAVS